MARNSDRLTLPSTDTARSNTRYSPASARLLLRMIIILAVQAVAMALYAVFVTYRMMGKNYDAAVLAIGTTRKAICDGPKRSVIACILAIAVGVAPRPNPYPGGAGGSDGAVCSVRHLSDDG
jgi:hypothetical protein